MILRGVTKRTLRIVSNAMRFKRGLSGAEDPVLYAEI